MNLCTKGELGKVEIDYIGIDTIEMYVLIFQRSLILFKANEVTLKPPVGLSCLFSFIRTEYYI